MKKENIPSIIIAGTSSSVGKTMITLGILKKLENNGFKTQSFKVGPDFIDPSYHYFITNRRSYNLDVWLMGEKTVKNTVIEKMKDADVAVIEGVMGLFDGSSGKNNYASTAHISKILKSPIILVIDSSKAARSLAALAYGFLNFDKTVNIAGIILNKVSGEKHYNYIKEAFMNKINIPIIATIKRNNKIEFIERHLGLVPSYELNKKKKYEILKIAEYISDNLNNDHIIEIAKKSRLENTIFEKNKITKKLNKIDFAVALDESFNFYYNQNINMLKANGFNIVFFSPIKDKKLPENIGGLYIGGGFPEVLSNRLSTNKEIMHEIKKKGEDGIPIYAECGGLMYLTKSIKNIAKKNKEKMVGLIDAETQMTKKLILNYTEAKLINLSFLGSMHNIRGHEFHYSEMKDISKDIRFIYKLTKGVGITEKKDGISLYNTIASYMHIYFQNGRYPKKLIQAATKYVRK
ncbi:MAG: cobyrinate a,c-diamide synthase [Nitrososphaeraceae archaeon]